MKIYTINSKLSTALICALSIILLSRQYSFLTCIRVHSDKLWLGKPFHSRQSMELPIEIWVCPQSYFAHCQTAQCSSDSFCNGSGARLPPELHFSIFSGSWQPSDFRSQICFFPPRTKHPWALCGNLKGSLGWIVVWAWSCCVHTPQSFLSFIFAPWAFGPRDEPVFFSPAPPLQGSYGIGWARTLSLSTLGSISWVWLAIFFRFLFLANESSLFCCAPWFL